MNASFPLDKNVIVRVSFKDGDIFRLRSCKTIDETIYNKKGLWSGEIVEVSKKSGEKLQFRVGGGLDFLEEDVVEIFDETAKKILFKR